jgi:hypothetical protein
MVSLLKGATVAGGGTLGTTRTCSSQVLTAYNNPSKLSPPSCEETACRPVYLMRPLRVRPEIMPGFGYITRAPGSDTVSTVLFKLGLSPNLPDDFKAGFSTVPFFLSKTPLYPERLSATTYGTLNTR